MTTLTIQSLRDIPYGKLDFNYPCRLVHGGREWKSGAHFVLANMFSDQMYAKAVNAASADAVDETYSDSKKKLFFETTSIAIRMAIEAKLAQDKTFAEALAATGDAALVYDSRNALMGAGGDGRSGKNMYGEWLRWLRPTSGSAAGPPDNRETAIYNAYVNTKLLIPLLRKHDLQVYIDRNYPRMSDLLKQLIHDVGHEAYRKLPDKETILTIHKNLNVDYSTNPSSLIKFVRRKHFREAREQNERQLKFSIFDAFVESVSHLYSAEPVRRSECMNRDRETMDARTVSNLVARTYQLFQNKSLPPAVQKRAETIAASLYIPPLSKIEQHERETFKQYPASEQQAFGRQQQQRAGSGTTIRIGSDDELGPSRVSEFQVDARRFPTVGHYVNFRYMTMFADPATCYPLLWDQKKRAWRSLVAVAGDVERQIAAAHDSKFSSLVNDMLAVKFQNETLHQLLLSTCGKQIETKHDPLFDSALTRFRDRTHPRVHVMTTLDNVMAIEPFRNLVSTLSQIFDSTLSNARSLSSQPPSSERMVASLFGFVASAEHPVPTTTTLHVDPSMNAYLHALVEKSLLLRYDALLAMYLYKSAQRRSAVVKFPKHLSFVVDARDNANAVALCRLCALLQALAGGMIDQNTVDAAVRTLRLETAVSDDEGGAGLNDDDDGAAIVSDDDGAIVSGGDTSNDDDDADDDDDGGGGGGDDDPEDESFFGSGKLTRFLEDISDATISEFIEDMLLEAVVGLRSSWSAAAQTIVSFFCTLPLEVEL